MRLTEDTVNGLVDGLASKLAGGRIGFYAGSPPNSPTVSVPIFQELVVLRLASPAFRPAVGGRATGLIPEPSDIRDTGEVAWARLSTATGEPVADLVVASPTSAEAKEADIIVDRTDFHRGGKCTVSSMALRLPLRA
jgi:hypothetical protein